jgi:enoyl-CoA hydratase
MADGLEAALDALEDDPAIWVGVLMGDGPVFCAGADLKVVAARQEHTLRTRRGGFAGIVERRRTKPLVAAVDGPALAGGTEIILACDLVVASVAATFGIPEVKRSLIASSGGLVRLPRLLPRNVAMQMAMTGEPLSSARAYELGLVTILTEPGAALGASMTLA